MQSELATALLGSNEGLLPLLSEPLSFDRQRRFDIYRNNVQQSLIEVLEASFPVIRELIGAEAFVTLANLFIRSQPPKSPYLVEYGDRFSNFIETRVELSDYPFLAEVAKVEYQLLRSTHAADEVAINDQLVALASDPDRLLASRFKFAAATALMPLRYAAASIWLAHQKSAPNLSGMEVNRSERLLISRPSFRAEIDLLDFDEFQFVAQLISGATIAKALDVVAEGFDLTVCLHRLLIRQVLTGVEEDEC